jgi:transposase
MFGIQEQGGKGTVSIVPNASAEALLTETVKKVRRGSIVYTDTWVGYDSLMFCGSKHLNIDHRYTFKQGKVYINGVEGFRSFAKERLIQHHGISKEKFPLSIKEIKWRYNKRIYSICWCVICEGLFLYNYQHVILGYSSMS